MEIPKKFHSLFGEPTLVVTASRQNAKYYLADQQAIELIDEIKIPNPHFSDHEGHFRQRGQGRTLRVGATYEPTTDLSRDEFLREFKNKTPSLLRKLEPGKIILLVPSYLKKMLLAQLPENVKKKVKSVIEGNFYHLNPLKLAEKIKANR